MCAMVYQLQSCQLCRFNFSLVVLCNELNEVGPDENFPPFTLDSFGAMYYIQHQITALFLTRTDVVIGESVVLFGKNRVLKLAVVNKIV